MNVDLSSLAILVPLVVGLVHVLKALALPGNVLPVLALVVGVLLSIGAWLALAVGGKSLFDAVVVGLVAGLAAMGLWSGAKNALQG